VVKYNTVYYNFIGKEMLDDTKFVL